MLNLTINQSNSICLPTSIDEITPEYLLEVTKEVKVAPYYCLIALVHKTRLGELVFANKKDKTGKTMIVVPEFVKANSDGFSATIKPTDKIVTSRSDLELGDQIRITNNQLSIGYVSTMVLSDKDLYKQIISNKYPMDVYLVEYKLIPESAIHGFYDGSVNPDNVLFKDYIETPADTMGVE